MGFLPIAVAIFGFVLLWAVVNYNSLLARKEQIRKMQEEGQVLEKKRNEILANLQAVFPLNSSESTAYLQKLKDFPPIQKAKTKVLTQQVRLYFSRTFSQPIPPETDILLSRLEDTGQHLYTLQHRLQQRVFTYNKLVNKMPSRIIALIFGFQPVPEAS